MILNSTRENTNNKNRRQDDPNEKQSPDSAVHQTGLRVFIHGAKHDEINKEELKHQKHQPHGNESLKEHFILEFNSTFPSVFFVPAFNFDAQLVSPLLRTSCFVNQLQLK